MKCETALLQNIQELDEFIKILQDENVHSYLEVGSKFGGSLWRIANQLPIGSKIVSVDLPHGDTSFKESLPPLQECISELKKRKYDVHLIIGDSTAPDIIAKVTALGPYDACLIDANHTLPYVRKDWQNYSPLCRLMAFHDIGFYRQGGLPPQKKPIEVPIFWKEIKGEYKHREIRHDKQDNGIGVLWH